MVHSLIFLIFTFICSAILLIEQQVSYIGLAYITIYVGSIAVLFLFIVMMLQDAKLNENYLTNHTQTDYLPVGGVLLAPLVYIFRTVKWDIIRNSVTPPNLYSVENISLEQLNINDSMGVVGQILYTDYLSLLLSASMVLLVGMIGAIILVQTNRMHIYKVIAKHQDISDQNSRYWESSPQKKPDLRKDSTIYLYWSSKIIPISPVLEFSLLGIALYIIGFWGIILNRRNIILILMSIELLLLGVNLLFVFSSVYLDDVFGQLFGLIILIVAGAESAIGLALIVTFFRVRGTIRPGSTLQSLPKLKG